MSRKGIMHRILPFNGTWTNRDVSEVTNGIMNGKINATGEILMNSAEVTLTDERIAPTSVILFSARSNSTFGLPFVKSKSKGSAIIGYSSGEAPSGDTGVPSKAIFLWNSPAIPTGYQACDGTNATPDLRDKFVVGAGNTYAVDAIGGSADSVNIKHSHTLSGTSSGGTISGTATSAGSHSHGFSPAVKGRTDNAGGDDKSYMIDKPDRGTDRGVVTTISITDGGAHTHSLSGSVTSSSVTGTAVETGVAGTNKNLPPYRSLYYITKIPSSSIKATEEESIFDYVVLG